MIVKRWDMFLELMEVNKINIPDSFKDQISALLKSKGNYTLDDTISILVNSYLNDCYEEGWLNASSNEVETQGPPQEDLSMESMLELLAVSEREKRDPNLYVQSTYEDKLNEIKIKYIKKIAPHNWYLSVSEWDRTSLMFHCELCKHDPYIKDVLIFFARLTTDGYDLLNLEDFDKIINEFDEGLRDAQTLFELIHDKEYYQEPEYMSSNNKVDTLSNQTSPPAGNEKKMSKTQPITAQTFFNVTSNYNKLKLFKFELENLGYITKNSSLDEFRRVFSFEGDPRKDTIMDQPNIQIKWLKNKSHLGYLIKLLSKHEIIEDKDYYKIAENCFLFDGEPIPNTVFHKMQQPANPVMRKIAKIVDALK